MALNMHPADEDDEKPLDPAAERVRQKLARLLLGSLGVMILGLVAVFAAILYKVNFDPGNVSRTASRDRDAGETAVGRIALPAGAAVVSTSLDDGRALLQLRNPDGSEALLFVDLRSGHVISRQDLVGE